MGVGVILGGSGGLSKYIYTPYSSYSNSSYQYETTCEASSDPPNRGLELLLGLHLQGFCSTGPVRF